MYKGAQSLDLHKTGALTAATWALGLGGGMALLVIPTALPVMKKNVIKIYNEDGTLKVVSDFVFRFELNLCHQYGCAGMCSTLDPSGSGLL